MLEILNLHVSTENKPILKGINLKIKPGEIHAIMGPNGSGKSSLSLALMGHPRYSITEGKILLDKEDITWLSPDKRARRGLYLAMQYPTSVPGVSVFNLLRTARKNLINEKIPALTLQNEVKNNMKNLKIEEKFLTRSINEGFSGGEKKKLEILQMATFEPKYAVLDEVDSGLDVDALKTVAQGINKVAGPKIGLLLITHYQRILKYIKPNFVHILVDGKIVRSGGAELAEEIEEKGYVKITHS